jgi:sugar phosphate isomerase/epimerase
LSHPIALCSEVYKTPIEETIRSVARAGYDGIEIAPFTIAHSVEEIAPARRREIWARARDEGIRISGLHWLLVSPAGLHLSADDGAVRRRTYEYLKQLARFCADLGGEYLVLGSPKQRNLPPGADPAPFRARVAEGLRGVAETCGQCGVRLLLEPLNPAETNFLTTVEEALELVAKVGHPAVGYILDVKAMGGMPGGIEETIRRHGAEAGHFHANEPGGLAPGMGTLDWKPIVAALRHSGYQGWISVEPFQYEPDPDTVARKAIEVLRVALG